MSGEMQASRHLSPGFLVASPRLDDTPFERAVIMMVEHDPEGAMGFIVNKPLELRFGSLMESVSEELGPAIERGHFEKPVHFGGPVRVEQLWLIFRRQLEGARWEPENQALMEKLHRPDDSALAIDEEWFLAASGELIEGFATGKQSGPFRPFIGYTGWGPGQLESEIDEGSWLALDFDDRFLWEVKEEDQWERALERLGVDAWSFMMMSRGGEA